MRKVSILVSIISMITLNTFSQTKIEEFTFDFNGVEMTGFYMYSENINPTSIVFMVPDGAPTSFSDTAHFLNRIGRQIMKKGIAICSYDRSGCGKSEGKFDYNQTIQIGAKEAIVAIKKIEELEFSGYKNIGLWSISRGGWISPIIIDKHPSISFWISVSGPDDKDNSIYKIGSNMKIMGSGDSKVTELMEIRKECNRIMWKGGSYEEYHKAMIHLDQDSIYVAFDGKSASEERYYEVQKEWLNKGYPFDKESGMIIMVPEMSKMLENMKIPVLAIFGEKDSQLDWKSTKNLYQTTIGKNEKAKLEVKTFPNGHHIIMECKTGAMNEKKFGGFCNGYFETMTNWLTENGFVN